MVLAVNWPPQAPAPGLATPSSSYSSSSVIRPAACAPTASKTSWIVTSLPWKWPGAIEPRQRHHGAGDRLVAPGDRDHRIEQVAARDELDRVGDHLAADQRRPHAGRAH